MSNLIHKYQILFGFIVIAVVLSLTVLFSEKIDVQTTAVSQKPVMQNVVASDDTKKIELSENKTYLFSEEFNPNKVTLFGIGIGDDVNKIKTENIDEKNDIWIHTLNGAGYRPVEGKIVELRISSDLAESFGIFRDDEIFIRFGEPDKIEDTSSEAFGGKVYFYVKKGLIVRYADKLGVSINILGK